MLFLIIGIMDSLLALAIAAIVISDSEKLARAYRVWMGEEEPTVTKINAFTAWFSWLKEKLFDWLDEREEKNAHKHRGPRHALTH
jgi:hypothetical protein